MNLRLAPQLYAVCKMDAGQCIPSWANGEVIAWLLVSDHATLVCHQRVVPDNISAEKDWRMIQVEGPLDFELVGILSELTGVLAEQKIPVFVLSSFETDFILVRAWDCDEAIHALAGAGHTFVT